MVIRFETFSAFGGGSVWSFFQHASQRGLRREVFFSGLIL